MTEPEAQSPGVNGFLVEPRIEGGHVYPGRLTLPDVQWRGLGPDAMATATVSLRVLEDASSSQLLWTDQEKQRGILPEALTQHPRVELCLSEGYPDPKRYKFNTSNADDLVEKLLAGQRLFLDPLVWNLRPGTFTAYADLGNRLIHFYDGKIYLPDSHHRHQALLKALDIYREAPNDYPSFQVGRQLQVELYFLEREDEGEFFYQKNELTKPTDKSKGIDIVQTDSLSVLTRLAVEKSPSLRGNVNRVTDRLSTANPQVVTLSTLRQMVQELVGDTFVVDSEIEEIASTFAQFYELLVESRPELGHLDIPDRREVRKDSLVDSAVMMYGYVEQMRNYRRDAEAERESRWRARLSILNDSNDYSYTPEGGSEPTWTGDFFAKANPIWLERGVLQPTRSGGIAVSNTRQTRSACAAALAERLTQPMNEPHTGPA